MPRRIAFLGMFPRAALVLVEGPPYGEAGPDASQAPPPGTGGQCQGEDDRPKAVPAPEGPPEPG
ncbi:hypothetical protein GCM10023346_46180 [Arthrobacter gyeryongensis]|uniref:Uncharacterized protein n=1 Tax=Arthrobacter gyeryongensis TaxID=1650592 RepID=A0ABP9SVN7_9MICC